MLVWCLNNYTGMSSVFLLKTYLTPVNRGPIPGYVPTPGNGWDISRCLEVVIAFPELKACFKRLGRLDPAWLRITDNWATLERVYKKERNKTQVKGERKFPSATHETLLKILGTRN